MRVKVSQNQRYVNTPKQEDECVITTADPFTEALPPVDEQCATKESVVSIVGIYSINKYKSCRSCSKKVTVTEKLAFCDHCKLAQKTSKCNSEWFLRVYVETSNPVEKIRLSLYNDVAIKLFNLCNLPAEPSDADIMEGILELDDVKILYDSQSHKIIDIELIQL